MSTQKLVKHIDYLSEDAPISNQTFGLISIVGPNLKQKCDVWGLKLRGVVNSLEQAKILTKKIMKADNNFDIYTVEIGKFFPLRVDVYDIQDVEYENEALNNLVKVYMDNKSKANDHWHERKQDMMEKAILEGKNQEEMINRPEHPIAVIQRVKNLENKRLEILKDLELLDIDITLSKDKYQTYTLEERQLADEQLIKAIKDNIDPNIPEIEEKTIEQIRNEIMQELQNENEKDEDISKSNELNISLTIDKLKSIDIDLQEYTDNLKLLDKNSSSELYNHLETKINTLNLKKNSLKELLNKNSTINNYINSNYKNDNINLL